MSEQTHMKSVSKAFRSRSSAFPTDEVEDPVEEGVVQRQNHSEHAGGERLEEPVDPPAATVPNTVNEGAETAAATTEAGEHQGEEPDSDPETDGVGESDTEE